MIERIKKKRTQKQHIKTSRFHITNKNTQDGYDGDSMLMFEGNTFFRFVCIFKTFHFSLDFALNIFGALLHFLKYA